MPEDRVAIVTGDAFSEQGRILRSDTKVGQIHLKGAQLVPEFDPAVCHQEEAVEKQCGADVLVEPAVAHEVVDWPTLHNEVENRVRYSGEQQPTCQKKRRNSLIPHRPSLDERTSSAV